MPCHSPDYNESELCEIENDKGNLHGKQFEAVLCGVFSILQQDDELQNYIYNIDWEEVGIPMELVESWWKNHQKEDEDRHLSLIHI